MAKPPLFAPAKFWLAQAREDFALVSKIGNAPECYSRYFLQQSYEKALKAYIISKLSGETRNVQKMLAETLLKTHSPLSDYSHRDLSELESIFKKKYPAQWRRGISVLKLLRREALDLIRNDRQLRILEAVDATRPSLQVNKPSYRYPFFDGTQFVSPANWTQWDTYQGDSLKHIKSSIDVLIEKVKVQVAIGSKRF